MQVYLSYAGDICNYESYSSLDSYRPWPTYTPRAPGAGRFTPRSFHTHSGAVISHPIFFSDQLFYCSNIIIIINGKATKIVYICIIYAISAQKLKYSIYMLLTKSELRGILRSFPTQFFIFYI